MDSVVHFNDDTSRSRPMTATSTASPAAQGVTPHPVMDRSPLLRGRLQALGWSSPETTWRGWVARYEFVCAQGHRILVGLTKSMSCGACRRDAILARLQAKAEQHGGACLERSYLGKKARHRFRCAQGHEWDILPGPVLHTNAWCKQCANQKLAVTRTHADGLQRLQVAAASRGGSCLSEHYAGVDFKHRFRCAHGHEWDAVGLSVLRGMWCRECVRNGQRLGIDAMRELARQRGGQCLSEVYVMNRLKLTWRCERGHEWQATPDGITRGKWCAQCANMNRITRADSKAWLKYTDSYRHGPDSSGPGTSTTERQAKEER